MWIFNSNVLHHIIAVRTTDRQDLNPDNSPLRDTISALEKILALPGTHRRPHQRSLLGRVLTTPVEVMNLRLSITISLLLFAAWL
jgi:hypothetical protein